MGGEWGSGYRNILRPQGADYFAALGPCGLAANVFFRIAKRLKQGLKFHFSFQ
jgi:hypothetical protein